MVAGAEFLDLLWRAGREQLLQHLVRELWEVGCGGGSQDLMAEGPAAGCLGCVAAP